jgi:hypothetical protein
MSRFIEGLLLEQRGGRIRLFRRAEEPGLERAPEDILFRAREMPRLRRPTEGRCLEG